MKQEIQIADKDTLNVVANNTKDILEKFGNGGMDDLIFKINELEDRVSSLQTSNTSLITKVSNLESSNSALTGKINMLSSNESNLFKASINELSLLLTETYMYNFTKEETVTLLSISGRGFVYLYTNQSGDAMTVTLDGAVVPIICFAQCSYAYRIPVSNSIQIVAKVKQSYIYQIITRFFNGQL